MGILYGLLAVCFFLVSHSQVKILGTLPLGEIVFIRAFGILILSVPICYFLKIPLLGNNRRDLVIRAIFGSVAMYCYFFTLTALPMASAVVIQQLSPLFAILVARFMLKERAHPIVYGLFFIALGGVVLIKGGVSGPWWYVLIGLVAALFSAVAYNYVRKLRATDHPLIVLSFFQYFLVGTSLVSFLFTPPVVPPREFLFPIVFLIISAFLAQYCLTLAFHKAAIARVSILGFLSIPGSLLIGSLYFKENLGPDQYLGIGLVLAAVILNQVFKEVKTKEDPKGLNAS